MPADDDTPPESVAYGRGGWLGTREGPAFPNTRWTLVQQAAATGSVADDALSEICRDYWYPLYAFARGKGNSPQDAQDLTQGFFQYLISGNRLARADREKGRLRSYLLGGLKHFMLSEWRKESAAKRGGGMTGFSIDADEAESRVRQELVADPSMSPDRLFERSWALQILERVGQRQEAELRSKGKGEQYEVLSPFLAWNAGEETYVSAGERLGMKEGAVKVAVHRMRKRYGELLRDEIAQTVSSAEEIPDELDALFAALQ